MSADALKAFFRTLLKVVPGGPAVGTPGANRAAGVLAALDKLADEVKTGANHQRGFQKSFRFLTRAEMGSPAYGETLQDLDPDTCCMQTLIGVEKYQPDLTKRARFNVTLRPRYLATSTMLIYVDGSFGPNDRIVPVEWVLLDESADPLNLPLLDPSYDYPVGYEVRQPYAGRDYLFYSAQGGVHPAPADQGGDAYWVPLILDPPVTALSTAYPLALAQYLLRSRPDAIKAGLTYRLGYGAWNGSTQAVVEVVGGASGFARLGTAVLADGTRLAVTVDVLAGTYAPVGGLQPTISFTNDQAFAAAQAGALVAGQPYLITADNGTRFTVTADSTHAFGFVGVADVVLPSGTILKAAGVRGDFVLPPGTLGTGFDFQARPELIAYADLLQEFNDRSEMRRQAFEIYGRPGSPNTSITVFFGGKDSNGWGIDSTPYTDAAGTLFQSRWGYYDLPSDTFRYPAAGGGSGPATTDALAEGTQHLYFTEPRTLAATLTGYAKASVNRGLAASDSLLSGFGVLEKRIDDNSAAVSTLAAAGQPVYARFADGSSKGYNTLDAALSEFSLRGGAISAALNSGALTVSTTNRGAWPAFFDGGGTTITIASGATLQISKAGISDLLFANFYLLGPGTVNLTGQLPAATGPGKASLLQNGQCYTTLNNDANVVALVNGYYKKITGQGTYYLLGTVQVDDFSQAPNVVDKRPGATSGGAGSGIDYANPLTLTQAATLQANKAHTLSGSGYALTLPSSPALGDLLFLLVATGATGLYQVAGTAYALYERESLTLRYTANGWTKVGGELLPLVVRRETDLSQQNAVAQNDYYNIPLSVTTETVAALPGLIGTMGIVVQRTGRAAVKAGVTLKNCSAAPNVTYFMGVAVYRNGQVLRPAQLIAAVGNGLAQMIIPVPETTYQAGDELVAYTYAENAGANLRGQYPGSQCFLTYSEIV